MDNLNIDTKNYKNTKDKQNILLRHGLRQITWQYLYLYNTYNTYTILTILTILIQYLQYLQYLYNTYTYTGTRRYVCDTSSQASVLVSCEEQRVLVVTGLWLWCSPRGLGLRGGLALQANQLVGGPVVVRVHNPPRLCRLCRTWSGSPSVFHPTPSQTPKYSLNNKMP